MREHGAVRQHQEQERERERGHVVDAFRVRGVRSRWGLGRVAAVDYIGHGPAGDQPVMRVWAWRGVTAVRRAVAAVVEEHRSYREEPASTLVVLVDSRPVSGPVLLAGTVAALRAQGLDLPTPSAVTTSAGAAGAGGVR